LKAAEVEAAAHASKAAGGGAAADGVPVVSVEVEGEGEGGGAAPDAPVVPVPVPVPDDEEPLLEPEAPLDYHPRYPPEDDDVEDEALIVKAKPGRKKTTVKKTEISKGYFMNDKRFDGDIIPAHVEQANEVWYSK
jgi:hypothetical protein